MSRLAEKIQVERLPEDRVGRIEQRVLAAYHSAEVGGSRSRPAFAGLVRWLAPAAAICGVALAIYLNLRHQESAQVQVIAPTAATVATRVETGAGEATRLELGDAVVEVGGETSVAIERSTDGSITLALEGGRVDCEVEPRDGRPAFVVRAGEVAVTVVGTAFSVERGEEVVVRVTRGKVAVDSSSGRSQIAAGSEWSGPAIRLAAADLAVIGEEPDRSAEEIAEATAPEVELPPRRKSRVPPTPVTSGEKDEVEAAPPSTAEVEDSIFAAEDLVEPREDDPDLQRYLDMEKRYPQAARAKYRELLPRQGKEARFAAYRRVAMAVADGQLDAAIKAADYFERRYPSGAYYEEVLWLRIRATCAGRVNQECRAAANSYLNKFADGGGSRVERCRQYANTLGSGG